MSEPIIQAMPSSEQSEKAVVCCMLRHAEFYSRGRAEGIDAAALHFPAPRIVFESIGQMVRDEAGEVDLITLYNHLNEIGLLERAGGMSEVADIYSYVTSPAGWSQWCATLREMKTRRIALESSVRMAAAQDSEEAIQEAKATLEALTKAASGARRSVTSKAASEAFLDRFKSDHESGTIPGRSTGIHPLDLVSGGMRPGEFWVVGGKPSRGKSVFMLQIAAEFISRDEPVAVFSLEMMAHEIIARLVSVSGRVNYGHLTQPRSCTREDLGRIRNTVGKLATAPFWIDSSAGQNVDTIQAESERIRDTHGSLSLVVVDYLQLIRGGRGRNESREEEIARVSGSLKQMAKSLNCPVLSASQLNENGQTRESRAIEQDADALLFIVEDGIKIGKLRNGRRDDVLPLYLHGDQQKFTSEPYIPTQR